MTKSILQIEAITEEELTNKILNGVKKILKNSEHEEVSEVLLDRREAAKILSVSLVTLWDWTRKDIIPSYRIGNQVRYKRSEIFVSLKKANNFKNQ
jgi:excisionase family DNA binding protein